MSANSGNNGVKNLRAMFENKGGDQSTSPPSRGRSPNPSEFSNGSRPVSKVRASFVAVEKPGENGGPAILGLRRASEVSSMGGIQENAIMEEDDKGKPGTAKDSIPKDTTTLATKPTPAVDSASDDGGLGKILKGSAFIENTPSKPPSAARDLGHAVASGQLKQKIPQTSPSKPKDQSNAATMVEKMQQAKESKPEPPPATALKTTENARPIKAPPTRQINPKAIPKSPIITQPSPRTPTSPKAHIKGGPAKIKGVTESAKEAQKAREAMKEQSDKQVKTLPAAPKMNTQAKSRPAPVASKPEQSPASPLSVRSPTTTKPRPTTVPARLPAAAMATTASAAAKHETQQSPTETASKPAVRKPSMVQMRPPRVSMSSTTSSLAKKASRASLTNGHQRPQSRASASQPNEGFLARMMRPTASSAQKTHDKVQTNSPPKTRAKTPASHKAKPTTARDPPPKMDIDALKEVRGDDRERKDTNGDHLTAQDSDALPDVAHPSSFDVVKPDPTDADTEKEPIGSESTAPVEQQPLNGEAQEVL